MEGRFWTAAGSGAPRRFWTAEFSRILFITLLAKAVSPLRSATALQINSDADGYLRRQRKMPSSSDRVNH